MFCHHLSRTEIHITKQPSGAYPNGRKYKYSSMETNPTATVRALTLQGGETALCGAFLFDAACSDLRGMSPSCCGSSPYPCRSLAYRNYFVYIVIISIPTDFVNYGTKKKSCCPCNSSVNGQLTADCSYLFSFGRIICFGPVSALSGTSTSLKLMLRVWMVWLHTCSCRWKKPRMVMGTQLYSSSG